jgi:hypothetical protein
MRRRSIDAKLEVISLEDRTLLSTGLLTIAPIHVAAEISKISASQQVSQVSVSKPVVTVSLSSDASAAAQGGTATGGNNIPTSGNVTATSTAVSGDTGNAKASSLTAAKAFVDPTKLKSALATAKSNTEATSGPSGPAASTLKATSGAASATGANANANANANGGISTTSATVKVDSSTGAQSVSQDVTSTQKI